MEAIKDSRYLIILALIICAVLYVADAKDAKAARLEHDRQEQNAWLYENQYQCLNGSDACMPGFLPPSKYVRN